MDQKLELLKAVPLFSGLDARSLAEVGRLADEVDVRAGKVLIEEDQFGHEFFVIVAGRVAIDRGGRRLRVMGPGDFFGEIALVDRGPRTATATAETDGRVLVIGHREFNSLMGAFPDVREQVILALARRVRNLAPESD